MRWFGMVGGDVWGMNKREPVESKQGVGESVKSRNRRPDMIGGSCLMCPA